MTLSSHQPSAYSRVFGDLNDNATVNLMTCNLPSI